MDQYSEFEITLNESKQKKRDSDTAENPEKKQLRRRRSSLASTRRSISGNIPGHNTDSCSEITSSCGSSTSSSQQNKPKPNPLNVRMDEIIEQFEANLSRLNLEYTQWKMTLANLEKEVEQTKLLSECNVSIQAGDIPQELKDLAHSEYITCDLMDLSAMEANVEKRLLQTYFNIEKCLQDMILFKECINTIKCHTSLHKGSFSKEVEGKESTSWGNLGVGDMSSSAPDIKTQIEWMMNN